MPPLSRALSLLSVVASGLVLACAHRAPMASPDPDGARAYRIGVLTANGDNVATSITTLRVVPRGERIFAFVTEHTEGSWEGGAAAMTYDSSRPKASDPWPITLQHAVASVPAPLRLDEAGKPETFEQVDAWTRAAHAAIDATELPPQARLSAEALVDPQGVLRDLARNFPGTPADDGSWVREEIIAGVHARRVETCEAVRAGKVSTWTCEGTVEGPTEGAARIIGSSQTSLTVDGSGLVELEVTYDGTLVLLSSDGKRALDRPIAGKRKVIRQ